jgi:Asp-tRNA(Asn)/Glu-tRNA(Gln) amidotransferase A subunit family amidase
VPKTPFSLAGTNVLCQPLDLPPVIGVTGGMAVGAVVALAICRVLPFIDRRATSLDTPHVPDSTRSRSWLARRVLSFTGPSNLTGSPAISIPAGDLHGLPFALQLVGAPGRERELLGIAATIETTT